MAASKHTIILCCRPLGGGNVGIGNAAHGALIDPPEQTYYGPSSERMYCNFFSVLIRGGEAINDTCSVSAR